MSQTLPLHHGRMGSAAWGNSLWEFMAPSRFFFSQRTNNTGFSKEELPSFPPYISSQCTQSKLVWALPWSGARPDQTREKGRSTSGPLKLPTVGSENYRSWGSALLSTPMHLVAANPLRESAPQLGCLHLALRSGVRLTGIAYASSICWVRIVPGEVSHQPDLMDEVCGQLCVVEAWFLPQDTHQHKP